MLLFGDLKGFLVPILIIKYIFVRKVPTSAAANSTVASLLSQN
jgi:hypothetical protein